MPWTDSLRIVGEHIHARSATFATQAHDAGERRTRKHARPWDSIHDKIEIVVVNRRAVWRPAIAVRGDEPKPDGRARR